MPAATTPQSALAGLWQTVGLPPGALEYAELHGSDPVLPSSFAVGTAAQSSIAAAALAAAEYWTHRGGARQRVRVDMLAAALEFRSERYTRVDGQPPPNLWDAIAGVYPCQDGRFVRLHTNFPHHRDGILALLDCAYDKDAVARALLGWQAEAFESEASARGLCVAMARSFDEWDRHPQGQAVARGELLTIEPIGAAPPRVPHPASRPLEGVRVLDLTRIIAGPVCGRTLAAHGADVLLVTSPKLPAIAPLVVDTGRGKRSCSIDLTCAAGRAQLEKLVRDADVFVQGYRPGGLEALGFGPERLARLKPGIVCVSLSAYGSTGPWCGRRGFDSLVQMTTGINWAEAEAAAKEVRIAGEPRALPAQALDHSAGYLMALAAIGALIRQREEGQSWHAQISLAQCARWLRGLGRIDDGFGVPEPCLEALGTLFEESASGFGSLRALRHSAQMAQTPARWDRPSVPLGSDLPSW